MASSGIHDRDTNRPPENCQERLPVCVGGAGAGCPQETGRWQKEGASRQMKCQGDVQR